MRSRLYGRGIGAQVFSSASPTCPPGQHWVADAPAPIRGLARELAISACVPNAVIRLRLPTPAPAPAPPVRVSLAPAVYAPPPAVTTTPPPSVTVFPAPPQLDQAPAPPVRAPALLCPEPWPLWWLVVAAGAGAFAGHLMKKDRTLKKNLGRIVNAVGGRMADRASRPIVARLLG